MPRWRVWLSVWAGWTALALFLAVGNSLTYLGNGRPANWALSIKRSIAGWWVWALLTPVVFALARRFPLGRRHLARNVAINVAAGVAVALAEMFIERAFFALLAGFWTYLLVSTFAFNFVMYALLVTAAHGVEYYRRSRERDQLEATLADTRLQLLGMQLQPHFLFNTLNTIAELVHEDADAADAMISGLSDLLRRSLELGAIQQIPLREELDLVSRYLDIQRARFGDRLHVTIAAPGNTLDVLVPALLLQPLVENAIRHGLGRKLDAGRIGIDARIDNDALMIVVTDDGDGAGEAGPERVGLGNTRARLEATYGDRARLHLGRANGRGARVTIELPKQARGSA
jgi:hypothetical protein